MGLELTLITALLVKHFLADFVLQTPYQVHNKGTWGHPAGFLHVGIHVVLTLLVLVLFVAIAFGQPLSLSLMFNLLMFEAVVHYHMDYIKCSINHYTKWTCADSHYWWLTGFDQLIHALTYVAIVALAI